MVLVRFPVNSGALVVKFWGSQCYTWIWGWEGIVSPLNPNPHIVEVSTVLLGKKEGRKRGKEERG